MTRQEIEAMADEKKTMTTKQAETSFILNPNGHTMMLMKSLAAVGYYTYKSKTGKNIFVSVA
jgi:hypothetical protein